MYIPLCLAAACAAAGAARLSAPDSSAHTIQAALAQLHSGKAAQAEQAALPLTREPAPHSRAWLVVAAARQQLGQHAKAEDAYKNFLASCNSEELRKYALREIDSCRAAQAKPLVPVAPSAKLTPERRAELAKVEADIRTESSDHFVVRSRNAKLSKLLVAEAETALARVCKLVLGTQEYPNTVEIYVWTDHEDYTAHAEDAPEWSGGSYSFATKDGIVGRRIDLMQLDAKGAFNTLILDRVLPHEMSHLVTREFFGDAPCPLFLNEGLAMLSEPLVDNDRLLLAGAALAGEKKIPLEDLILLKRQDRADVSLFYAESYSLMCYLHSRLSPEQFKELLGSIKSGCTVDDSLHRVLYMPQENALLPNLAAAWQKDAADQAQYLRALAGDMKPPGRP